MHEDIVFCRGSILTTLEVYHGTCESQIQRPSTNTISPALSLKLRGLLVVTLGVIKVVNSAL